MGNSAKSKEERESLKEGESKKKDDKEKSSKLKMKAHKQVIESMTKTMYSTIQQKENYPLLSTVMEIKDLGIHTMYDYEVNGTNSTEEEKEGAKTQNEEELKQNSNDKLRTSGSENKSLSTNEMYRHDAASIQIRLDFDYDEYVNHKQTYDTQIGQEISKLYGMDPNEIVFVNYERGSTKIGVRFYNIWRWWKREMMDNLDEEKVAAHFYHTIRPQDQVEVKYKNEWYMSTVVDIQDKGGFAKYFQVRFNPKDDDDGEDPFLWNTEWFYTDNEDGRLCYDGKPVVLFRNGQGEDVTIPWLPPNFANVVRHRIEDVQVNDHIVVKWKKSDKYSWNRCKVFSRDDTDPNRILIKVTNLQTGKTKKLKLWDSVIGGDKDIISLTDKRPPKEGQ